MINTLKGKQILKQYIKTFYAGSNEESKDGCKIGNEKYSCKKILDNLILYKQELKKRTTELKERDRKINGIKIQAGKIISKNKTELESKGNEIKKLKDTIETLKKDKERYDRLIKYNITRIQPIPKTERELKIEKVMDNVKKTDFEIEGSQGQIFRHNKSLIKVTDGKFTKDEIDILNIVKPNPFIMNMIDNWKDGNKYYIEMEDSGISLKNLNLNQQEYIFIIFIIFLNSYYLHCNKIIHMDIKDDNIVINKNGYPIIIDFGISLLNENENESNLLELIPKEKYENITYAYHRSPLRNYQKAHYDSDYWSIINLLFKLLFKKDILNKRTPVQLMMFLLDSNDNGETFFANDANINKLFKSQNIIEKKGEIDSLQLNHGGTNIFEYMLSEEFLCCHCKKDIDENCEDKDCSKRDCINNDYLMQSEIKYPDNYPNEPHNKKYVIKNILRFFHNYFDISKLDELLEIYDNINNRKREDNLNLIHTKLKEMWKLDDYDTFLSGILAKTHETPSKEKKIYIE